MIDVIVPLEQEGTQAVVRSWLKAVGDRVEVNDPLVELETDKVAVEVPAPAAGVLREILLNTNDEAVPGAVLARISPVAEVAGHEPDSEPVRVEPSRDAPRQGVSTSFEGNVGAKFPDREIRLSPSVKRACLQHNVDPASIEGTGRNGRITRADVDRFLAAAAVRPAPAVPPRLRGSGRHQRA